MKDIGKVIRRVRQAEKVTQTDLAKRAGICQAYLCECESGKYIPSLRLVDAIFRALGYEISVDVRKI